jgi:lactate dehydrogenase-like 2-hydroxyacid dehydrogenase
MAERTLGVLGLGNVGGAVAKIGSDRLEPESHDLTRG